MLEIYGFFWSSDRSNANNHIRGNNVKAPFGSYFLCKLARYIILSLYASPGKNEIINILCYGGSHHFYIYSWIFNSADNDFNQYFLR